MYDGSRRSQMYSDEYGWLGPDLTQNIQGRRYPNIPGGLVTPKAFKPIV